MVKRQELSISVHQKATKTEILHLIFILYCKRILVMGQKAGTVICPARLFHLYGKQLTQTENLLEAFNTEILEELRKKT